MNYNSFFPTIIGSVQNTDNEKIAEELIPHCIQISQTVESGGKGWLSSKTYNTSDGKYDLSSDQKFFKINNWVETQIKLYCNELDIETDTLVSTGSWFNIYHKNDFQEPHVHPNSSISAIYILTCPEDGARIFFNSPRNNMYHVKKQVKKQEMVDQIICPSLSGTLLIFPSYLNHAVEKHISETIRISFSYNYKN